MREIKNSRYGIPYQGSKRAIAHKLLEQMLEKMPRAKYFVDLFGGGGAMSACALENGLIVHYNELKPNLADLFKLAVIEGIPKDWRRWISREEFDRFKKEDSVFGEFIRCVWSFGNKGGNYLFGKDKEGWKKAGHLFLTELDQEGLKVFEDRLGYPRSLKEISKAFENLSLSERRSIWVNVILKLEAMQVSGLYEKRPDLIDLDFEAIRSIKQSEIIALINEYCPDVPKKLYKRNRELKELKQLQQLQQLQRLEQLQQLEQLSPKISFSSLDFREVKVDTPISETIIYCDPPYKGTTGYGKESFDSDSFFEWCAKNEYNVFVSEYAEIENLHKVFEVKKRALMDKNATHCVNEKLFFNKKTTLF